MSCPTNAPINLPSAVNQPCSSKCNFEYNLVPEVIENINTPKKKAIA